MAALKRDYYEILGVSRDADDEAIRRAFQEQARLWHPDLADSPQAEERFRDLAEAYSVLSQRDSRALYDQQVEVIPAGPSDVTLELNVRTVEAEQGARRVVGYSVREPCQNCSGLGVMGESDEVCDVCAGTGTAEGKRRLRVVTPESVEHGTWLRVKGEGHKPGPDVPPGDLFVHLNIRDAPTDRPAVRYLALALLLVAVVALVVYILH